MRLCLRFSQWIDRINSIIGRVVMYGVYFLMAILLWSSISKTFFMPVNWTLEMAQFAMVSYYMLGGAVCAALGCERKNGFILRNLVRAQKSNNRYDYRVFLNFLFKRTRFC